MKLLKRAEAETPRSGLISFAISLSRETKDGKAVHKDVLVPINSR
jgi:hypothetical protein